MRAAASGLSSKHIARCLGISHRTVHKHRQNAMRKLGAATLSSLIVAFDALPSPPADHPQRITTTQSG